MYHQYYHLKYYFPIDIHVENIAPLYFCNICSMRSLMLVNNVHFG